MDWIPKTADQLNQLIDHYERITYGSKSCQADFNKKRKYIWRKLFSQAMSWLQTHKYMQSVPDTDELNVINSHDQKSMTFIFKIDTGYKSFIFTEQWIKVYLGKSPYDLTKKSTDYRLFNVHITPQRICLFLNLALFTLSYAEDKNVQKPIFPELAAIYHYLHNQSLLISKNKLSYNKIMRNRARNLILGAITHSSDAFKDTKSSILKPKNYPQLLQTFEITLYNTSTHLTLFNLTTYESNALYSMSINQKKVNGKLCGNATINRFSQIDKRNSQKTKGDYTKMSDKRFNNKITDKENNIQHAIDSLVKIHNKIRSHDNINTPLDWLSAWHKTFDIIAKYAPRGSYHIPSYKTDMFTIKYNKQGDPIVEIQHELSYKILSANCKNNTTPISSDLRELIILALYTLSFRTHSKFPALALTYYTLIYLEQGTSSYPEVCAKSSTIYKRSYRIIKDLVDRYHLKFDPYKLDKDRYPSYKFLLDEVANIFGFISVPDHNNFNIFEKTTLLNMSTQLFETISNWNRIERRLIDSGVNVDAEPDKYKNTERKGENEVNLSSNTKNSMRNAPDEGTRLNHKLISLKQQIERIASQIKQTEFSIKKYKQTPKQVKSATYHFITRFYSPVNEDLGGTWFINLLAVLGIILSVTKDLHVKIASYPIYVYSWRVATCLFILIALFGIFNALDMKSILKLWATLKVRIRELHNKNNR